jgi:uncharacterized protein YabN with tetrapyrrole methylase and pyrophosphatase domain
MGHLTRDAEVALHECRTRFYMHSDAEVRQYLHSLPGRAVDVFTFYNENESRLGAYRRIAAVTLDTAQKDPPVCVALYGHPLVLSTLSTMVMCGADWLRLETTVVPGVSSLDTVIADLRLDPGAAGIQLQEATDLLLYRRTLDPQLGLLIFQVPQLGTVLHSSSESLPQRFRPFLQYLMVFYPAGHPMYLVRSAQKRSDRPQLHMLLLSADTNLAERLAPETTIYIPPVIGTLAEDSRVRRALTDKSWLEQMVAEG